MKTLLQTIKEADEVEIDAMFAVLKYRNFGILRKLRVFSLILDIEEEPVLAEAPQDEQGRIKDYETRHLICDALVARSQQLQKEQTA